MKIVTNDTSGAAFVTFNSTPDIRRVFQRNQEYIGGYRLTHENQTEEEATEEVEQEEQPEVSRETGEARIREELLEIGRLFVRNIPFTTKEEDLHFLFKSYGEIAKVQVIVDKKTGKCKGFAIVDFVFPESAVGAYAASDGKIFKGRMLHILPGSEKREKNDADKTAASENTSYKKEKMANAGVRLALAETRLVRETSEFFLKNGGCFDAFSRPAAKRSDTVIITKNLPAGVEVEELERMFEKFGEVEKVLMPQEGGISATVMMSNAVDAKKAFQALAYSVCGKGAEVVGDNTIDEKYLIATSEQP